MAQGPEANLWRAMRAALPQGALAERIENRHGGGIADVLLIWDGLTLLVELKAPKALPDRWFDFANLQNAKVDFANCKDFAGPTVLASKMLRPEQIAFHARVLRAGGVSHILARPQTTKVLELFRPIRDPAAPGQDPAAPGQDPAAPGQDPAAPGLRLRHVARARAWPEIFAAMRADAEQGA